MGGTNADGTTTGESGFDTSLTLFDGADNTIAYYGDDTTGFVNTDPNTGLAADSYFTQAVTPGIYRLAIAECDNFARTNFSDYFEAGNPTFTNARGGTDLRFSLPSECVQGGQVGISCGMSGCSGPICQDSKSAFVKVDYVSLLSSVLVGHF